MKAAGKNRLKLCFKPLGWGSAAQYLSVQVKKSEPSVIWCYFNRNGIYAVG